VKIRQVMVYGVTKALVSVGRRGLGPGFEWLAGRRSMSFVSKVFTNVMS